MSKKQTGFDVRYLIIIAFAIIFIVSFYPIGLPVAITNATVLAFNFVDSLPPGARVSYEVGLTTMVATTEEYAWKDVLNTMIKKNLHIFIWAITPDEVAINEKYLEDVLGTSTPNTHPLYDKNIVNLGLSSGGTPQGIQAMALNSKYLGADAYGTPISNLQMMANINTANDWDCYVGTPVQNPVITQFNLQKKTITITYQLQMPNIQSGLQNGLIVGYVADVKGAAEWEALSHTPGAAIKPQDASSLIMIYGLLLVVIGNILYITEILNKRGVKGRSKIDNTV
jgi:hypothetical protein